MNEEIVVGMGLDTSAFARGLRSARENLREFKSSATETMKDFGKSLFASFASLASFEGLKSILEFGEGIKRNAEIAAVSTDFIQTLGYAMRQTGGSAETATKGLEKLNIKIGEARSGNKEAQKAFSELGISVDHVNGTGKDTEEIFREVADKIHNSRDGAERARIAFDLFGKSGQELIPILQGGSKALEDWSNKATKLSESDLENISRLNVELKNSANFAQVLGGKLIGLYSDFYQLQGAFFSEGADAAADFLANRGAEADEANLKRLSGLQFASAKNIAELKQKLAADEEKRFDSSLDKQGQLNALFFKAAGLELDIQKTGQGEEAILKKKIELSRVLDEIQTKSQQVSDESNRIAEKHTRELQRQADMLDAINRASREANNAQGELDNAKASRSQYTIGELANSRFNFGGALGQDQSISRQISQFEKYASFNKEHGDVDTLKYDLSHIDELRKGLSSNVLETEREPFKRLEEHAAEQSMHLKTLVDKAVREGLIVIPKAP